ncbi:hypothetical protein VOLCADRAFT_106229 [Volvox carteri f. nagariensis]|uniref:F-box domain-containing protein n=1 Tax=Volvox carteri f. nagariensis TaxID=3068 RepID=D8U5Z7_VOLCA|nr:uncharacterized protein VOLCADRAFT_106229 [Volvox carteri f. nagariensis]EFJ44770.1 hypothetical protein VOLCADRAFT_106229 [Volvox carteri f. nagariensis]|eukprot:XP_002954053.1 hypothetical protein VOLCADRAFT_106229 [Volvox carteri f. nagariensis]
MPGAEILRLGTDTLLRILQYLDVESLAALCCTCRDLRSAAETPSLWKSLAHERWYHAHTASFPAASEPGASRGSMPIAPNANRQAQGTGGCATSWKGLFAGGNGWEPPRLRHTAKLRCLLSPCALQLLWLPNPINLPPGNANAPQGTAGLLLALGLGKTLELWQFSSAAFKFTVGGGSTTTARNHGSSPHGPVTGDAGAAANSSDLTPSTCRDRTSDCNASNPGKGIDTSTGGCDGGGGGDGGLLLHSLHVEEGVSSVAWIVGPPGGAGGSPGWAGSSGGGVSSASASGSDEMLPVDGTAGPSTGPTQRPAPCKPATASAATVPAKSAIAAMKPVVLAVGTRRGKVEWYRYNDDVMRRQGSCRSTDRAAAGHCRESYGDGGVSGALRLLCTTDCGRSTPLAEMHLLPASGGGGGGGLLAALQRSDSVLDWGASQNAVQLYDVASQRHLLTVCEPHKPRSATAALYTLDVRCGLTQRFGLPHRSMYPRIATAREHYVFTSHAGIALEVYDRRAMSVPLYSCARLPWRSSGQEEGEEEEGGEEEEEGQEGVGVLEEEEGDVGPVHASYYPDFRECNPGWSNRPAKANIRHQALWLESNGDVLVGRSDNGTLWVWDLSTVLGWARGPDRSGLWHWLYEHGPLELGDDFTAMASPEAAATWQWSGAASGLGRGEVTTATTALFGDSAGGGSGIELGTAPFGGGGQDGGTRCGRGPAVAAAAPGKPICLGSVVHGAAMPLFALATGASTALFNLASVLCRGTLDVRDQHKEHYQNNHI